MHLRNVRGTWGKMQELWTYNQDINAIGNKTNISKPGAKNIILIILKFFYGYWRGNIVSVIFVQDLIISISIQVIITFKSKPKYCQSNIKKILPFKFPFFCNLESQKN